MLQTTAIKVKHALEGEKDLKAKDAQRRSVMLRLSALARKRTSHDNNVVAPGPSMILDCHFTSIIFFASRNSPLSSRQK
jgi:hypothetical protein